MCGKPDPGERNSPSGCTREGSRGSCEVLVGLGVWEQGWCWNMCNPELLV